MKYIARLVGYTKLVQRWVAQNIKSAMISLHARPSCGVYLPSRKKTQQIRNPSNRQRLKHRIAEGDGGDGDEDGDGRVVPPLDTVNYP